MTEAFEPDAGDLTDCDIEARIELADRRMVGCRIKDLTPSTVRIEVSEADRLPDEFDLLVPVVHGIDQRCRVRTVRRRDDVVEGAFVTPLGRDAVADVKS